MNSDRAWVQTRKAEFERLLTEPLEVLCVALASAFEQRDLPTRADPVKSWFRIYRAPLARQVAIQTNRGASFAWMATAGGTAPGS